MSYIRRTPDLVFDGKDRPLQDGRRYPFEDPFYNGMTPAEIKVRDGRGRANEPDRVLFIATSLATAYKFNPKKPNAHFVYVFSESKTF